MIDKMMTTQQRFWVCLFFLMLTTFDCSALGAGAPNTQVQVPTMGSVENARELNTEKPNAGSWMAVPIPMSNPSLGSGLQVVAAYLHKKTDEDSPNGTTAVGGMYTDTNSWAVGAVYDDYWLHDQIRFNAMVARGKLNLNFYGIDNDTSSQRALQDNPLKYGVTANALSLKALFIIPGTDNWYMGPRYVYADTQLSFDFAQLGEDLPVLSVSSVISGLGFQVAFDTRDDNYYPSSGHQFDSSIVNNHPVFGSDFDFIDSETAYKYYKPLGVAEKQTLAFQLKLDYLIGSAPFYLLPTLKMRGFDSSRYSNNAATSGHVEWRYKFAKRFGVVAFTEMGTSANTINELANSRLITSYGAGVRWQVTADKKINLGVDAAFSGDLAAMYIRVGEAF